MEQVKRKSRFQGSFLFDRGVLLRYLASHTERNIKGRFNNKQARLTSAGLAGSGHTDPSAEGAKNPNISLTRDNQTLQSRGAGKRRL